MGKKVYDTIDDIPKEPEGTEKEAEKEAPKEPDEKPCKKKKPVEAPPHLPVGCTHD